MIIIIITIITGIFIIIIITFIVITILFFYFIVIATIFGFYWLKKILMYMYTVGHIGLNKTKDFAQQTSRWGELMGTNKGFILLGSPHIATVW
jgi:hypothetical protein